MRFTSLIAATAAIAISAGSASAAITLDFGQNVFSTEGTGASGRAVLSFTDEAGDVRVSAKVTNTTGNPVFGLGATSSKLMGFGFDLVSGASYIEGTFNAGAYFKHLVKKANAAPFGSLDVAGSANNNYQGGNPNGALPEGKTDTFSLRLATILNAAGLESAFQTAFTSNPALTAAMRFQEINGGSNSGGSDKLSKPSVGPSPVPVPPAALSLLLGFGGLGAIGALRRRLGLRGATA